MNNNFSNECQNIENEKDDEENKNSCPIGISIFQNQLYYL